MTDLAALAGERLSARELEVLRLVADGLGDEEIGRLLFVSVNTVKSHLRRIIVKLGVRDRTHAVALAYESNLLASPAFDLVAAARLFLVEIPPCAVHVDAVTGSCEACRRWVSAQRLAAESDLLLAGGVHG